MFLNKYCILGIVMLALAAWAFPFGIAIDVAIVFAWYYIRKMRGNTNLEEPNALQSGGDSTSDLLKMMMITILSEKLPEGMKIVPKGNELKELTGTGTGTETGTTSKKSFFSKANGPVTMKTAKGKIEWNYKDDFM
ncbi:MAG: hypothetical protein ACTSUE_09420 [Promethearchaeota archaeon]